MKLTRLIPNAAGEEHARDLEITFYGLTEFRLENTEGNGLWIGQNTGTGA